MRSRVRAIDGMSLIGRRGERDPVRFRFPRETVLVNVRPHILFDLGLRLLRELLRLRRLVRPVRTLLFRDVVRYLSGGVSLF
jgi:hypothetical protein